MAYTAQNIENIIKYEDIETYIAHARKMIESLEMAEIQYDAQGRDTVSLAHLYGGLFIEIETAEPQAVAYTSYSDWSASLNLSNFGGDQSLGMAWARAELVARLQDDAQTLLNRSRADLELLLAAEQAHLPNSTNHPR